MHAHDLKKAGESDERIWAVAAWRDASFFTDAERAALALTEAVTRISDSADPVPDEVLDNAAKHFEEPALASLILHIAMINTWNRLNAATRQVAGAGERRSERNLKHNHQIQTGTFGATEKAESRQRW